MKSPTKKTTAAMLAGLAAGGAAGAMLFAPGVSSALQEDSTSDSSTELTVAEAGPRAERRGDRLTNLAEILGIDEEALKVALSDGQTVAEIAEANGIDVDSVVDQLVADATARLEERIAELPTHIEDFVNGDFERPGPGFGDRAGHHGGPPADAESD